MTQSRIEAEASLLASLIVFLPFVAVVLAMKFC